MCVGVYVGMLARSKKTPIGLETWHNSSSRYNVEAFVDFRFKRSRVSVRVRVRVRVGLGIGYDVVRRRGFASPHSAHTRYTAR